MAVTFNYNPSEINIAWNDVAIGGFSPNDFISITVDQPMNSTIIGKNNQAIRMPSPTLTATIRISMFGLDPESTTGLKVPSVGDLSGNNAPPASTELMLALQADGLFNDEDREDTSTGTMTFSDPNGSILVAFNRVYVERLPDFTLNAKNAPVHTWVFKGYGVYFQRPEGGSPFDFDPFSFG